MSGKHADVHARRVVTGLDHEGRSTIVLDEISTTRIVAEAFSVCDVWTTPALPSPVLQSDALDGTVLLNPPLTGFTYRLVSFPPDADIDVAAAYGTSLDAIGAGDSQSPGAELAGLHQTDTVDVVTVLSGEIYAVLETTETLLKPGDSFVQRGTQHSWSNRTQEACTLVVVQMGAVR
jgi:mannose-6-phosphate isomerase-like protein (cupin superfamily)